MTKVRIPGFCEGSDLGTDAEPVNWIHYDTDVGTESIRVEWNPKYVPPPPPSEREELQREIERLQREIEGLQADLAELDEEGET